MVALSDVAAVVTDIEGTTTPISFVKDTLFPYARAHLPQFLAEHARDADVAAAVERVASIANIPAVNLSQIASTLETWMDEDRKDEPLKTLQGLIWQDGYLHGELRSAIYPDAAEVLASWAQCGLCLAVYSSGSVLAQKLLFGSAPSGDMAKLFEAFFDTEVGAKREASSYRAITRRLGLAAKNVLFLSDIAEELDAAAEAGLNTIQVVRPADGTVPSTRHALVSSFSEIVLNGKG